jgi:CRP-like cAMP-binding protein
LASVALLRGMSHEALRDLVPLLARRDIRAGETVFSEGDPGRSMLIVAAGRLEVARRLPGQLRRTLAHVGPGEPLGEMALVSGRPRSASVRSLEPTTAWELDARAFELLRSDGRPVAVELVRRIGESALRRLRREYALIARALEEQTGGEPAPPADRGSAFEMVPPEPHEAAYLSSVLCFRGLSPMQIAQATAGLRRTAVPRGAIVVDAGARPSALLIIVRGALESTINRGDRLQRVRLAGPGRAAGHLGVLDDSPSPIAVRARERSILLEFPRERVEAIVRSPASLDRAITSAIHVDVVHALQAAGRPHGHMAAALVQRHALGAA